MHAAPRASMRRCLHAAFHLCATMPALTSLHLDIPACDAVTSSCIFHSLQYDRSLQNKLRGLVLAESSNIADNRAAEAVAGLRSASQLRTLDLRNFRAEGKVWITPQDPACLLAAAVRDLTHLQSLSMDSGQFMPVLSAPPPVASLPWTVERLAHLTSLHLDGRLPAGQIQGLAAQPTAYTCLLYTSPSPRD